MQPHNSLSSTLMSTSATNAKPTLWILLVFCFVKLAIHLPNDSAYSHFRDELYYLDCADHLAWGYVDQPPFSIVVLALVKAMFGTSLLAIRLPVILAGAVTPLIVGLTVWRMGGGRFAQALASLCVLITPTFLGANTFFSMNAFDHLFWMLLLYLLVRIVNTQDPRLWLWFGFISGLGLLNKISVGFLGFGVVVALLLTNHRHFFRSWELWTGGLIALAINSPNIFWQVANGFPTLEFIDTALSNKTLKKSLLSFFMTEILIMHPINAPLWIGGLLVGLLCRWARSWRILSVMFLAIFGLLALNKTKTYYLAPAFPGVFALGAIALERWTHRHNWIRTIAFTLISAGGLILMPLALPVLAPQTYDEYMVALGIVPPEQEVGDKGARIPQFLADRIGWEPMVKMIAAQYDKLNDEDRSRCSILTGNYGEAGAINLYGPHFGLPKAISSHNNHYMWGFGAATGEVMLIYVGELSRQQLDVLFESVQQVAHFSQPYIMPEQQGRDLFLCRGLRISIQELFKSLRNFG